ncbi:MULTISPECIES: DnaB-like helicase C-terminal domain-containing protein [unclassified Streptomyces]|uniref:DnaB-like helicase C-terminal domain-containing protein n=1 Tax=unclassified Streptomyces TaxID=2593676 RepID=UPI002DD80AC4|nr:MULTISPECIES: DnaB-like helicase C-terminal domain-containing protein [unclassified Streptomyces]
MDVTLSQARERWSEVVERLQQGDQVVLTNAKSGQAALLRRPEESDRAPAGTWTSTRARQELGSLISAAQEEPQLLTVGARPAAIVLRHQAPAGQPQREAEPGVTGLGDVLDGLLETAPQHSGLSTGVAALDRACGGLARGSVTLVAAPPNAGGSLLPLQAARAAAFHSEQPTPVLYVPSGVPLQVAARRLIAAEAPVPYAQFAAGTLTAGQRQAVLDADSRLRAAPLSFTRPEPTVQAITEEASRIEGLGLVVVDRLQHARAEGTPLSGRALPTVMTSLARLATDRQAAVVVLLDTDDAQILARLDADRILHLTRPGDGATARITVTARDLGTLTAVEVALDMTHLRLLDQPAPPAPSTATPATTPALPAPAPHAGAARGPAQTSPPPAPTSPRPQRAGAGSAGPARARPSAAVHKNSGAVAGLVERIEGKVHTVLTDTGGEVEEAVAALKKTAIPDVMDLLDASRTGGRYDFRNYPDLPDILHKRGREESDDIWEARPHFTAPPEVLDQIGGGVVTALDINGAYLSALKAHLPIGQLEHHLGPDAGGPAHDTKRSGVHLVTPPAWEHADLPNPIGDREEPGQIWITESTLRLLLRLSGPKLGLCERPLIHESWTSGSTEQLLETLRRALVQVRTNALVAGSAHGEAAYEYVKAMYSKLVSTMGESNYNRDLYRSDWMHIIRSQAFANLWHKAWSARQAGLTVVRMMGTDELHLAGNWRTARAAGKDTPLFPEGREVTEVKPKQLYRLEKVAEGSYREREAD